MLKAPFRLSVARLGNVSLPGVWHIASDVVMTLVQLLKVRERG